MRAKKIILYIVLLIMGFLVGTMIANAQEPIKSKIIGKWKIDKVHIPQMVDDVIAQVMKKDPNQAELLSNQRGAIEAILEEVVVEYKKDGTYYINVPNNPQEGKWEISADKKKIIRKQNDGKETVSEIIEATGRKLVIINEDKRTLTYHAL